MNLWNMPPVLVKALISSVFNSPLSDWINIISSSVISVLMNFKTSLSNFCNTLKKWCRFYVFIISFFIQYSKYIRSGAKKNNKVFNEYISVYARLGVRLLPPPDTSKYQSFPLIFARCCAVKVCEKVGFARAHVSHKSASAVTLFEIFSGNLRPRYLFL